MTDLTCDVAIIGAGTAGLAAERAARRAGARTLLIDDHFAGTTCATVGCMPSKLLIAAAEAAHAMRQADVFGVHADGVRIDGAAVMARVQRERDRFAALTRKAFADLPDGVALQARAWFTGPGQLRLEDGRTVQARTVVIATGARPAIPPPFHAVMDRVLTHETIFELADLPESIAVIGAGPIGLELAQAFARLGVRVAVFDQGSRLGGVSDKAVADRLLAMLERDMPVRLDTDVEVSPENDGVRLRWPGGDAWFARVLVATGRRPDLAGLTLDAAGLALDGHGVPRFDPCTMQCDGAPVFLAGDADGVRPVLHEASAEGAIAGHNAAVWPAVMPRRRTVPFTLMFTDPPVALLGETQDRDGIVAGVADYADQGRARIMARNEGLVKLYAERESGALVGAVMACPGTEHMAHLIAWAIEKRQTASDLQDLPIYHPTLEEGLRPALRAICAQLELAVPEARDTGSPPGG